jgi:hypothetical protein
VRHTIQHQELSHERLVVLDLSVLRGRPEKFIADDEGIVLPDILVAEIATGDRVENEAGQFADWLRAQAHRLYVGNYWWDISAYESSIKRIAPAHEAIIWPLTRQLRVDAVAATARVWLERFTLARDINWPKNHELGRDKFLDMCRVFEEVLAKEYRDLLDQIQTETTEELGKRAREPSAVTLVAPMLARYFNLAHERYGSQAWIDALTEFPDRRAIGRYSRILYWYMLLKCSGRTRKFGNNWEDSHYAFLTSYVGAIATTDGGMRALIEAVFPYCEVRSAR